MDPYYLGIGYSLDAQRICAAQVRLLGERERLEGLLVLYLGKVDVLEFLPVKRATLLYDGKKLHNVRELFLVHPHENQKMVKSC